MNRRHARIFGIFIAFAGIFQVTAAAQKADLAGTWQLNKAKSFFGSDHPATEYQLTETITQSGDEISVTDAAVRQEMMGFHLPDSKTTTALIPDGKEREIKGTPLFPGMPQPTVDLSSEWQGGTLYITQRGVAFGGLSVSHKRYYLSADGSQLIELVDSHSTFGDGQQRLVFDKQN